MTERTSFLLIYDPATYGHLRAIDRKYHSMIRAAIEEQLAHEPLVETRNRKPLARLPEFGAQWELRCGAGNRFRVLYRVDEAKREVQILAIGLKERNRLVIGREEFML